MISYRLATATDIYLYYIKRDKFTFVEIFDMAIQLADAHPQSQITGLAWLDDESVVSVGQDGNTRVWNVPKA